MSLDTLGDLNWLAVVVAALAYFVLGAIWYAPPVFGKSWSSAGGFAPPAEGQGPGPAVFVGPLVGNLIASVATGMLTIATGSATVSDGIVLGLVIGIGYAFTLLGITAIFESNKPAPLTWFLITATYHLVGLVIVAVILSTWA